MKLMQDSVTPAMYLSPALTNNSWRMCFASSSPFALCVSGSRLASSILVAKKSSTVYDACVVDGSRSRVGPHCYRCQNWSPGDHNLAEVVHLRGDPLDLLHQCGRQHARRVQGGTDCSSWGMRFAVSSIVTGSSPSEGLFEDVVIVLLLPLLLIRLLGNRRLDLREERKATL